MPIIRIQNLNNPEASFNFCPELLPEKFRVRNGDLLFAWSGTPGTSFGAHIWRGEEAWLNQHIFKVLFDREHLDERFLRFAINQNLATYVRQAHGGAGLAHITKGRFEESELLLAPLNEQRRIVAKIEELFSDLDAGVAALERAKAKLKRYRASVLKAAVEGKLTGAWRAQHPNTEPASTLLHRILHERRQKWEADQLAKFASAGKEPPKNWTAKYVEPSQPDTSGLPELPTGWCWTSIGHCFEVCVGATPSRRRADYWGGDIAWVSSGQVQFCTIREPAEWITKRGLENSNTKLNPAGSILIGMIGEGRTRGQVAILDIEACNNQNCAAIWVPHTPIPTQYVYYWLWSQYEVTRKRGSGNNQPALNKQRVEAIPFPLPPLAEQQRILDEVAERLSQIEAAGTNVEHGLRRAARLRQSILKQAFEGKLVPQDSTDEAASVLLERLRANRSAHEDNGHATSRNRSRRSKAKQTEGADE